MSLAQFSILWAAGWLPAAMGSRLDLFAWEGLALLALGSILAGMSRRLLRRGNRAEAPLRRRVLIVGAGPAGCELAEQIRKSPLPGLNLAGFLDDGQPDAAGPGKILGALGEAAQVIQREQIDTVVITLPNHAYKEIAQLVEALSRLPVQVWGIPDYFGLDGEWPGDLAGRAGPYSPGLSQAQRRVKRAFDLILSCLLLPIALPLMGLVALAIWLEDRGPVFFWQQRVGEQGRLFPMLKFRTMVPGAENLLHLVEHYDNQGNLIHKQAGDPRVTQVGRFLRRTSLDELPQLLNTLRGEMSLVGPRPELPYLVNLYAPWQRRRFSVPQGITGWWQVNGRSDKPMHLHTGDDLYYIDHYSLLLDVYILFKTIGVVIRGKGAY